MQDSVSWLFDGRRFVRNVDIAWDAGLFTTVKTNESGKPARPVLALPGLINLHTHLELTAVAGATPRRAPFPEWVGALRKVTMNWRPDEFNTSLQMGIQQVLRAGTTTVLDVGNSSANWDAVPMASIRLLAMRELIGLDSDLAQRRYEHANLALQDEPIGANGRRGMSLHAPFSCAQNLFAQVSVFQQARQLPLTIHMAESREEAELYSSAKGIFRDWLDGFGAAHAFKEPLLHGIVDTVCQWGMRLPAVFVHGNTFSVKELEQIATSGSFLVHCPQSARWFGHPQLDLDLCRSLGVNVCIGTDSSASAESLSLWEQLRVLAQAYPERSVAEWLAMVTSVPGQALRGIGRLGEVQSGASADFVLVALPDGWDEADWHWLLQNPPRILQVIVNGQTVFQEGDQ